MARRGAHDEGYRNLSARRTLFDGPRPEAEAPARPIEWRPLIKPAPDYATAEEQAIYESAEALIRPGETRSEWVERVRAMVGRAAPSRPSSQERMQYGPGADDE